MPMSKSAVLFPISQAVSQIGATRADAIMTLTKTGSTARNVSVPTADPILAVTPHVDVARRLQLVWSNPIGPRPASAGQTFQAAINVAQEKAAFPGRFGSDAGTLQGIAGSTDLIKVEVVTAVGHGVGLGQGSVSGRARVAYHGMDVSNFNLGDPSSTAHKCRFCGGDSQGIWNCYRRGESDKPCCGDWLASGHTGDCGCEAGDESYSGWGDSDFGYALDLLRCFKRWLKG